MEELAKVRKYYQRGVYGNTQEEADNIYFAKIADMLNLGSIIISDLTMIEAAGVVNREGE